MSSRAADVFHPAVRAWFLDSFATPTRAQQAGWPAIARGESTLILAPTGSGKTLAAFLWCLNRLIFEPPPPTPDRCRVLYVSPLKALAWDVERNLRVPLAGIAATAAAQDTPIHTPSIAVRTGDTPARERTRFARDPADILITTPESLFLLLTSAARARLAHVDTVIIDEIHALVPNKRGAHLALSLERLEALRPRSARPLQRIGLSATQRPLEEVARFLGGAEPRRTREADHGGSGARERAPLTEADLREEFGARAAAPVYRPVTIVDASDRKGISLRIELPVESMARTDPHSIWSSIYPRLLELVHGHTSTLIFVNSRRLAERLANAVNDLANEPLVRSHHGSLAPDARREVEDLLKAGQIRGLVATSSLELGIDMGAIDLVVQIEAPPSVASGLQRVGRAGHQAGATSEGVIFPKFRGDLVACAAVARAMREGKVESIRYPRNPLDVLAQQVVAMAAGEPWRVADLFGLVRCATPFATLGRRLFDGVLDMLSGRYPSDEFASLRPRLTWDRAHGIVTGREGAARVAVANAGTIPDRGLYGVFLAGADRPTRVGELDEEMVFETAVGDTFTLGASTWRVEEITHDRVLVTPAPGEPGKMPFWHGDRAGRPAELGYTIGRLMRDLRAVPHAAAVDRLVRLHGVDAGAAEHLLAYLDDQARAGVVPDDRTIVIERCLDELGDWRVCVLSPLGSRVHAPWAMAVTAAVRQRTGMDVQVLWGDEGFVVRFPEVERPPDAALMVPAAEDVEPLVVQELGGTSLFAARFRETAARSLLLPRRRPGRRTPLWHQRKRASDLLAVASQFGSFPAVLETYREILRDQFDMPALVDTLRRIASRRLHVVTVDSTAPSPFAASLLFSYVANYIYDGDAPLAERRAQALSVDQAQLRELLGDAELRDLLDEDALASVERELQHLDERYRARSADGVHDLLLRIGDLRLDEIASRATVSDPADVVRQLQEAGRIVLLSIGGEPRYVAVEDASRYRDALGVSLPDSLPPPLLEPVADATGDITARYARSHAAFTTGDFAARYAIERASADERLRHAAANGRVIEGEFRPGGVGREWIDANVLRTVRRRSLARLRRETEPVDADALGRHLVSWHGIDAGRKGPEALLDVIEQLQGAAIPASVLETDVLPARIAEYNPALLDTLMAAGEVAWVGVEPLGDRDGRVALYLTDDLEQLRRRGIGPSPAGRAAEIVSYLRAHGASFFAAIHDSTGGGFPAETVNALWSLVWQGLVTNDTLHPLRAFLTPEDTRRPQKTPAASFRSRRLVPPTAEGRWSLVERSRTKSSSATEWAAAVARQLLARYGIVTRETVSAEATTGGFTAVYQVLKAMEDAGKVRRGYFVAGLGAAQFATPAALDLLRAMREKPDDARAVLLAATDPANPYGSILRWPPPARHEDEPGRPTRSAGARVVLVDGACAAYLRRGERELLLTTGDEEPGRSRVVREVARALRRLSESRDEARQGLLIEDINGRAAPADAAADVFVEEGFLRTALGLQLRPARRGADAAARR